MWNCNSSASPACPARRVLPIVTQSTAADERAATFSGIAPGGSPSPAARPPDFAGQEEGPPSGLSGRAGSRSSRSSVSSYQRSNREPLQPRSATRRRYVSGLPMAGSRGTGSLLDSEERNLLASDSTRLPLTCARRPEAAPCEGAASAVKCKARAGGKTVSRGGRPALPPPLLPAVPSSIWPASNLSGGDFSN